jgi:2-haloacid dehalogenase
MATLAFDIYGTLLDTEGVVSILRETIGSKAEEFSRTWRRKQLEYSFRRGLMSRYENFAVCTRQALKYCCDFHKVSLAPEQEEALLQSYRTLPAFDDIKESLAALRADGHHLYAFSNGTAEAVEALLVANDLSDDVLGVVSCDAVKTFKPNREVYDYFMQETNSSGNAWLISSNPFDVIGAISSGMKAVWVQRSDNAVFDPWDIPPTITIRGLSDLQKHIGNLTNPGG